ncbi:MAG: hypothetical protein NTW74_03240 [Acidobacteria bacterium]|nr:hypothetical protein [Acidobacteriota bacterium]
MLSRRALLFQSSALLAQDVTFSTGVNVINLLATVRDKQGNLIQTLKQEDFLLSETNKPKKSPTSRSNPTSRSASAS